MYSSYYSIIKFVGFNSIYYVINQCVVSIFSEFVCVVFLSVHCHFKSIKLFCFKKNFNICNKLALPLKFYGRNLIRGVCSP